MQNFWTALQSNVVFFMQFIGIVAALFLAAYGIERFYNLREGYQGRILSTRKLTMTALFSAVACILMMFELPLPFAPAFYKIDASELPVLILSFAYGPVAGVLAEFCKILLKLFFRSTSTAFVGELANFVVGVSFILPASTLYLFRKTRGIAIGGAVLGTLVMTVCGSAFNAFYLLPKFAQMYGMPLESIVAMGTAINPNIRSVVELVLWSVVPLNLLKGGLVSLLTLLSYKRLSLMLKTEEAAKGRRSSADAFSAH